MSFRLKDFTWAESDAGESVTVPARETIRYQGRGLDLTLPYGAGAEAAVLYADALDAAPPGQRAAVRQALDEAAALLFDGRYFWV